MKTTPFPPGDPGRFRAPRSSLVPTNYNLPCYLISGPADQEVIEDIWNDEQADEEEIVINPNDLSPEANIPLNVENNFEDGQINTGAFNGQLADDDMQGMTDKEKKIILLYLLLLETHEIEEKLREKELQDEYVKVREAIEEYKRNTEWKNNEDLRRRYNYDGGETKRRLEETNELSLDNLSRKDILMLLRELQDETEGHNNEDLQQRGERWGGGL